MNTLSGYRADEDTRSRARRGLGVFFAVLVPLTVVPIWLATSTGILLLSLVAAFSPAIASVVVRLGLREGFADVSFRLGGGRGLRALLVTPVVPLAVCSLSFGLAWATGLAGFDPIPGAIPLAGLLGEGASPVAVFATQVAVATLLVSIPISAISFGEELGWRGYMLTRFIDAGVPRPILLHGLVWALWHLPIFLVGYASGPYSPALAFGILAVQITTAGYILARLRLSTGSVWPAVLFHGMWNSIIQQGFDPAKTGVGAALWVGESGLLTTLALILAAAIFSLGRWSYVRSLPASEAAPADERPGPAEGGDLPKIEPSTP